MRLIDQLLESIQPGSPSLDQVWSLEIKERVRVFDHGKTDVFSNPMMYLLKSGVR